MITAETRHQFPDQMTELEGLAVGAEVDFEDLLLVNLRGDLTNLGEGCSDVAITADSDLRLTAHNEDGAPELDGLCLFVTVHIEGQTPVTSVWYPGLLPGMTCWLNGAGLACGVDHIPVDPPGIGAGRHFLARKLQEATSIEAMVRLAESATVAGGYSYTVGSASERQAVNLEVGPTGMHLREVVGLHVHTNHFLYLEDPQDPDRRSYNRLDVLKQISETSDVDQLLAAMTADNRGVKRDAIDGDTLMTHCSIVFDFEQRVASIVVRHDPTVHALTFSELLG